jgi:hypothetical protein
MAQIAGQRTRISLPSGPRMARRRPVAERDCIRLAAASSSGGRSGVNSQTWSTTGCRGQRVSATRAPQRVTGIAALSDTFNDMPASLAEAGYDLSLKAVEEQESRLADLRSRTGTLLAAASLAASFLGGQSIRTGELRFLGVLAIIAYLICVGACIKVLLPHGLVFSFRGSVLMQAAPEAAVDELEDALEAAMGWIESFIDSSRSELDALARWYTSACLALGLEIVLWLLGAPGILD